MALQGASNVLRDDSGNITFTPINGRQVRGIAGEFSDDSVKTARQYIVYGDATFARLFYIAEKALSSGSSEKSPVAIQGVTETAGTYAVGILVNPKEHFTNGFVTTLQAGEYMLNSATNGTSGTIATRGHIWVFAKDAVTAGGAVYADKDGAFYGSADNGKSGEQKVEYTAVAGAKWLTSAAAGKLAEIAIDTPTVTVAADADDGE